MPLCVLWDRDWLQDFDPHSCGVAEGSEDVVGELESQAVLVWVDKLEQEQMFGGQQRGRFWKRSGEP